MGGDWAHAAEVGGRHGSPTSASKSSDTRSHKGVPYWTKHHPLSTHLGTKHHPFVTPGRWCFWALPSLLPPLGQLVTPSHRSLAVGHGPRPPSPPSLGAHDEAEQVPLGVEGPEVVRVHLEELQRPSASEAQSRIGWVGRNPPRRRVCAPPCSVRAWKAEKPGGRSREVLGATLAWGVEVAWGVPKIVWIEIRL